ncbi:MAG: hypothetical protein ACJ71D_01135, partial [Nitrososphaera sp.]
PLLDEWIGAISSSDWDRNQCAKLIAEATNDLGSLHEHTSTNPSMYALDQDDQLGHNQDDVFEHHHCSRWWCTGCYGTIQLPSVGNFYAGEKLTDDQLFTVPGNREKAESLSEILDLLQILNLNSIVMSVSDAMTREELAELSKALGLE